MSITLRISTCVALIVLSMTIANAQKLYEYTPAYPRVNIALARADSSGTYVRYSDTNQSVLRFGATNNYQGLGWYAEYAFACQWTLPILFVPYSARIMSATLSFEYDSMSYAPWAGFYHINSPLEGIYDSLIWVDMDSLYIGEGTGTPRDLTANFDSASAFVQDIQNAISSPTHDNIYRLGIRSMNNTYILPWSQIAWDVPATSVRLTLRFTAPGDSVTITNNVHGFDDYDKEQSYVRGDTNVWAESEVSHIALPDFRRPPVKVFWTYDMPHLAETWMTRYDSTAEIQKYHDWNDDPWQYCVLYWATHDTITHKYFNTAKNLSHGEIHADIELYHPKDSIPFEFTDPWRNIQNNTNKFQQLGYQPTTHCAPYVPWDDGTTLGLFLGQNWERNMPSYSIRPWRYLEHLASHVYVKTNKQSLAEGDAIFLGEIANAGNGWRFNTPSAVTTEDVSNSQDEYRENRILFNDSNSVTTMLYKAHLLSDQSETYPTMRGNQRRIEYDTADCLYHMVYESAGEIWYTQSADSGVTWSREELVSQMHADSTRPVPGYQDPSIAVIDSVAYVVYHEGADVYLRSRFRGQWMDPWNTTQGFMAQSAIAGATPVVDVGRGCNYQFFPGHNRVVFMVWEGSNDLRYSALWLDTNNVSRDEIIDQELTTQVTSQPVYPSLASLDDDMTFGVAWRDGGIVYYREAILQNCGKWLVSIKDTESVNDSSTLCIHAPSLTHDKEGQATVAWESIKEYVPPVWDEHWVNVKTRSNWGWATTAYLTHYTTPYTGPANPTIGAHAIEDMCDTISARGLHVSYNNGVGSIHTVYIDCDLDFETDQEPSDSYFANMTSYSPYTDGLREVFSYPHQSPVNWAIRCTNRYLSKATTTSLHLFKELKVRHGRRTACLEIGEPRLAYPSSPAEPIRWRSAHDTLVIGINTTLEAKTRTAPFTVGENAVLSFDRIVNGSQPAGFPAALRLKVQVRDAVTDQVVYEHPVQANTIASDTSVRSTQSIALASLVGHTVYACMGMEGGPSGSSIDVSKVLYDDNSLPRMTAASNASSLPDGFELDQNSPNPFTAATVITFRVPVSSHVRLAVSDLLGREVAVLVDEERAAGPHTVRFDGAALPNGTYLCTLQIEGAKVTRRMTLAR